MKINTPAEFKTCLENGPYAWPGGYPLYFVLEDGEPLSFKAAIEEQDTIIQAIDSRNDGQWNVIGCQVNWEDEELICIHTGTAIPAAYPSDKEYGQ